MGSRDVSTWSSKSSNDLHICVRGVPFNLDSGVLASKSAKVNDLLNKKRHKELSDFLKDIPSDVKTFELVARFCYGFQLTVSTQNVIPLVCVADYLGMTDTHCSHNLLTKTLTFLDQQVLPNWNETIKALRVAEHFLQQAFHLGLINACVESLIAKALIDPLLLGTPVKNLNDDDTDDADADEGGLYKPNARRRLFALDWQPEDLTTLSLELYEHTIHSMNSRGVPLEYIAASVCQYAKRWIFPRNEEEDMSDYEKKSVRDVIEAVEKMLPSDRGLLPCAFLFEMLKCTNSFEASEDCTTGLEIRIGKQLEEANVADLLIPSQGYVNKDQYDIECLRRILKIFYSSYSYRSSHITGMIKVAELMEEFMVEIASNIDLKMDTFLSMAEMSHVASTGTHRNADGVYRAIDIYLDKHRYLGESDKEEICRVLDCHKMSREAIKHASQNERLPLRVVVQMLFVAQLQLRDTISNQLPSPDQKLIKGEGDGEHGNCEQLVMNEITIMNNKVVELERECSLIKKEIEHTCSSNKNSKLSLWKEMKRKFGCITTMPDCDCQVKKKKKVHPGSTK